MCIVALPALVTLVRADPAAEQREYRYVVKFVDRQVSMSLCTGTCVQVVLTSCMMNMYRHSLYFLLSFSSSLFSLIAPLSDSSSRFTVQSNMAWNSHETAVPGGPAWNVYFDMSRKHGWWSRMSELSSCIWYTPLHTPLKQGPRPLKVIPFSHPFWTSKMQMQIWRCQRHDAFPPPEIGVAWCIANLRWSKSS